MPAHIEVKAEDAIERVPRQFELIYRAHAGMVLRTASRITGSLHDAEDVLQTVFLRLVARSEDAPRVADPASYLRRAAIHAALDVVRARGRDAELSAEESVPHAPDDLPLRQALRAALARLDPRQAEIFALRFLEGHSNGEIARLLGMSQILVAVTVHRARKKLQKELKAYEGEHS